MTSLDTSLLSWDIFCAVLLLLMYFILGVRFELQLSVLLFLLSLDYLSVFCTLWNCVVTVGRKELGKGSTVYSVFRRSFFITGENELVGSLGCWGNFRGIILVGHYSFRGDLRSSSVFVVRRNVCDLDKEAGKKGLQIGRAHV